MAARLQLHARCQSSSCQCLQSFKLLKIFEVFEATGHTNLKGCGGPGVERTAPLRSAQIAMMLPRGFPLLRCPNEGRRKYLQDTGICKKNQLPFMPPKQQSLLRKINTKSAILSVTLSGASHDMFYSIRNDAKICQVMQNGSDCIVSRNNS